VHEQKTKCTHRQDAKNDAMSDLAKTHRKPCLVSLDAPY